jgi:hypothetical protein
MLKEWLCSYLNLRRQHTWQSVPYSFVELPPLDVVVGHPRPLPPSSWTWQHFEREIAQLLKTTETPHVGVGLVLVRFSCDLYWWQSASLVSCHRPLGLGKILKEQSRSFLNLSIGPVLVCLSCNFGLRSSAPHSSLSTRSPGLCFVSPPLEWGHRLSSIRHASGDSAWLAWLTSGSASHR